MSGRRTAYSRGEQDGRGGSVIEPPIDAVKKTATPVSQDSDDSFSQNVRIVKATNDSGEMLLFGVVMRPLAVDAHGEFADASIVKKAAHDFLAGYGSAHGMGVNHRSFDEPIELVESVIETTDHEKHGLPVLKGDWTVTARVNSDDLKEQVTKNSLTGFSIGGFGSKAVVDEVEHVAKSLDGAEHKPVRKFTKLSVHEISLVDAPANEILFVIAKRRSKDDEMKIKTDDEKAAEALVAAQNQAKELSDKLAATQAELDAAKEAAKATPEPAKAPEAAKATPEPAKAPEAAKVADAPAETPAPVADVKKAKRFTKGRAAMLKIMQDNLAALMNDLDAADESETSEEDSPAPVAVITKSISQTEIDAAIAKAMKPLTDKIASLESDLKTATNEVEIVKAARIPATRGNGENVTKQRDNPGLWDNVL